MSNKARKVNLNVVIHPYRLLYRFTHISTTIILFMVEIPLETERANQFSKQRDFVSTVVKGHTFTISSKYNLSKSKVLGAGAFGIVITAFDPLRKKEVAVKRVRPYAEALSDAMLTLREIRLMKHLGSHPNVCDSSNIAIIFIWLISSILILDHLFV